MLDSIHPIRDLAYQLWEQQGCPSGRDMDHWLEAERLLRSETAVPAQSVKSSAVVAKKEKVKKADKRVNGGKDGRDRKKQKRERTSLAT